MLRIALLGALPSQRRASLVLAAYIGSTLDVEQQQFRAGSRNVVRRFALAKRRRVDRPRACWRSAADDALERD